MDKKHIQRWIDQTYDIGEVRIWKIRSDGKGIICYCLDGNVDVYSFDQMK